MTDAPRSLDLAGCVRHGEPAADVGIQPPRPWPDATGTGIPSPREVFEALALEHARLGDEMFRREHGVASPSLATRAIVDAWTARFDAARSPTDWADERSSALAHLRAACEAAGDNRYLLAPDDGHEAAGVKVKVPAHVIGACAREYLQRRAEGRDGYDADTHAVAFIRGYVACAVTFAQGVDGEVGLGEPAFVAAARKAVAGSGRFRAAVDAEEAKIIGRPEPSRPMVDACLDDLVDLIAGRGRWAALGSGMWTYPDATDENHAKLHAACLRLEAEGRIKRAPVSSERAVLWRVAS